MTHDKPSLPRKVRVALALLAFVLVTTPVALVGVTLPHTFANNTLADAAQINANFTALSTAVDTKDTIPAGAVQYFAMATCPTGWLKADGNNHNRADHPALFTAIGTTYGTGTGATQFNVPDLRGVFPRGVDDGRGIDPSRALGSYQDQDFKSFSMWNENPSSADYVHGPVYFAKSGRNGNLFGAYWSNPSGKISIQWDGSEVRPRNVALRACIKR